MLKGGFFIEAGANDAESDSDSLHFELNRGWGGLLVEPNPFSFQQCKAKHRKEQLTHNIDFPFILNTNISLLIGKIFEQFCYNSHLCHLYEFVIIFSSQKRHG